MFVYIFRYLWKLFSFLIISLLDLFITVIYNWKHFIFYKREYLLVINHINISFTYITYRQYTYWYLIKNLPIMSLCLDWDVLYFVCESLSLSSLFRMQSKYCLSWETWIWILYSSDIPFKLDRERTGQGHTNLVKLTGKRNSCQTGTSVLLRKTKIINRQVCN